ncbi:hypothetical protein [Pseudoruegeria sp. HB172150]|uniref:hypothetical protein n=1 Tax=Pseudoruegeria sp. HB172150 TaxID=2721164 RepID=UPI0015539C19|nr:hypothetical protein [Pseudoruegeria sp. HB172150]
MAIRTEHELHKRRFSRNLGVGLALASFVLLVFALSVVKIQRVGPVEGFDHQPRTTLLPAEQSE